MFCQASEEVAFHDAPAYFSEHDWKHLHKWQKELYSNVMKEIHQALLSLGPIIATTVVSLSSKDKEELIYEDHQNLDRRHGINRSPKSGMTNQEVLLRISREDNQYTKTPVNPEQKRDKKQGFNTVFNSGSHLRKEEPDTILIDHLGEEVGSSSFDPITGLILATDGTSFRSKEDEKPSPKNIENSGRRHNLNHSPSDLMTNPDVFFTTNNRAEYQYLKAPPAADQREKMENNDCRNKDFNTDIGLRKEEPVTILIDDLGEEVGESNSDLNSEHKVVSFRVKGDDESYCMDQQDSESIKEFSNTTGNGYMSRKRCISNSFRFNDKYRLRRFMQKKSRSNLLHSIYEKGGAMGNMGSGSGRVRREEEATQWPSGSSPRTHSNVYQTATNAQRSNLYSECENTMRNEDIMVNRQQSCGSYSYPEGEQSSQENSQLVLQRTHKVKGKHTCAECGKSFSAMSNLVAHERIHTGERPYHCIVCGSNFNQIGALHRHQKLHTGEKPYECNVCGKRFNRKYHLLGHEKVHLAQQSCDIDLLETL